MDRYNGAINEAQDNLYFLKFCIHVGKRELQYIKLHREEM